MSKSYEELYKKEDIIVLDAGKYRFDNLVTFKDSEKLFDDLWKDWF